MGVWVESKITKNLFANVRYSPTSEDGLEIWKREDTTASKLGPVCKQGTYVDSIDLNKNSHH